MIIRTKEQLGAALTLINSSLYLTYDIETTGLNPRKDKIIGFGCANPEDLGNVFYVIMKEFKDNELVDVLSNLDVLPLIKALVKKRLITWNGSFDTRFTHHYFGVNLVDSIYCDGMLALHTIDENRMSYALKPTAAEFLGGDATEAQLLMKESIKANGGSDKEYYKADSALMARYGIQDNVMTAKLFNIFDKELKAQSLSRFFYVDEVMPLYREVTIPMELKGVPLDIPLMNQTLTEVKTDMDVLLNSIQTEINPLLTEFNTWYLNKEYPIALSGEFLNTLASIIAPTDWPKTRAGGYSFSVVAFKKKPHLLTSDLWRIYSGEVKLSAELVTQVRETMQRRTGEQYIFNILSKDHLKRLIFTKMEETPISRTDKGSPQVDDLLLDSLANKYNWVKNLRTYNKLNKIKSTYIEAYLEKQEDGMFYPSYFQHRTISGRYGSNLQQLPRAIEFDDGSPVFKYTNLIRKFFIAGEGFKFIDDDYESLEPHTFAHVSGDEGLKNIFRKNFDFYSTIAIATEGLVGYSADKKADNYLGKKNKSARQAAKAYSLGIPYGMQAYALAMNLKDTGMDINDRGAQILINKYLNAYADLKQWMTDSDEFAKVNGYIKIESGRIRHMPELPGLIKKYKGIDMTNHLEIWKAYNDRGPAEYTKAKEDGKKIRNYLNNAKNVQIQGLAASIVNRASIALAKKLKIENDGSYICAQVHDEILLRVPENSVDKLKAIMQDSMENTYKLSIALKAPPSVGNNFAESKG